MLKYFKARSDLPKLTERQEKKLKQLSVVSIASKTRVRISHKNSLAYKFKLITYDLLSQTLHFSSVREIEDFLIDSIYQGLFKGKLNHSQKLFEVDEVFGRDIQSKDIERMIGTLQAWQSNSVETIDKIDQKIKIASEQQQISAKRKTALEKLINEKIDAIKAVQLSQEIESKKFVM